MELDEGDALRGDAKKARINSLEENRQLKERIIGYLGNHYSELKVNDCPDETAWERVLAAMVEGEFKDAEAERIFDDLTGNEFDLEKVKSARAEEIEFVKGLQVYEEVPNGESWIHTGTGPIGTRWVDILKGEINRSRLVAQDYKRKGDNNREDLFAAMPPLEAKKALFRMAAAN